LRAARRDPDHADAHIGQEGVDRGRRMMR
jgi:hypothetical protein